jgi:uncharacterized protein
VELEWDEAKRQHNLTKHGLDFTGAFEVLRGNTVEFTDDRDDYGEERIIALGLLNYTVVNLVYTMREDIYRIISLRKTTENEQKIYFSSLY